ncbi:Bax inhibitor-1/YccA family membrane protein [Streptomyces justiciae]|uniref:Bax inhibitor-1/YccA family membrane protein n=1 Tax=Streptomyces justiciae TaxID=2780140 RepID=UPI001882C8DB|nr:Bax inhibitor-1/YccA family protein [Streptomyces justiciae]MBE8478450.1 Bax inhibitor-1/YccA family protein [Streptomyces justiciae]
MTPVEQHRSLKSSNPILAWPQFERRGGQKTMAKDPRAGIAVVQGRSTTGQDLDQAHGSDTDPLPLTVGDLMTMDDVLPRWLAGLGVTALAVTLSWTLLPHLPIGTVAAYAIAGGAGLPAAALVIVQCRRKRPSPTLTLMFAAVQGICLGVLSATAFNRLSPGLLVQTVLGSMATSAGVLLAYRLRWMRVHRRRYGFAGAVVFALCFVALADTALFPLMGADGLGLHSAGLGVLMGVVGVALGMSFLPLHLRKVEGAVTHGASRDQRWPAAFGLTLSLAWLYVETVRLFTLYPAEDLY